APPPQPAVAEVTNEATREAVRPDAPDAMTVVSIAADAPTMVTTTPQRGSSPATKAAAGPFGQQQLDRVTIGSSPRPTVEKPPPPKSRMPFIAIAAIVVLLLAIGAWIVT